MLDLVSCKYSVGMLCEAQASFIGVLVLSLTPKVSSNYNHNCITLDTPDALFDTLLY